MQLIPEDIKGYAERISSPESDVLQRLNRDTHAKIINPRMLSGHLQGKLLEMISRMLHPKRILEIGTFTGYSAICLAQGLATDGQLHTIEHNPELEDFTKKYIAEAGLQKQIVLHQGKALDVIPQLQDIYDLVFIDADKPNYVNYFELVFNKLRSGGVILADNVLWGGRVLDPDGHFTQTKTSLHALNADADTRGIREYNDHVSKHAGIENLLLPFRDGLMISIKK
jgi:caffeoyl-CoA O-methyltransferase